MPLPREEYPRPQFVREGWTNLNGPWDFSFEEGKYDRTILVPYACEAELSGIGETGFHDRVFYRRRFCLEELAENTRTLLHFGAVDYRCKVYLNGQHIGGHTGGHIGFTLDITHAVRAGENELQVDVWDEAADLSIPRGKQFWEEQSRSIFYTRTTGIWQTVWLETVHETHLEEVAITPDLDSTSVTFSYRTAGNPSACLKAEVSFKGQPVSSITLSPVRATGSFTLALDNEALGKWNFQEDLSWSPEHPNLFDVRFTLSLDGWETDRVDSYFGVRKISIEDGRFLLNNRPYYQKLLLDQGYWPQSLLTAPDDEAFITDIRLSKEMGFNGVRKHQKIEDPRFLYHADRMGFLVWGEIAAAYVYSEDYVRRFTNEWMEEIRRDYNHPSIVAWTPLNESWGVPQIAHDRRQQQHSAAMVCLTKSLDATRPVISNDGWEHTCTDLLTVHDYASGYEELCGRYRSIDSILSSQPAGRRLFAEGFAYAGQPVLVSEFGGISFCCGEQQGWGYSSALNGEDFARRYQAVVGALLDSPTVCGFCYTQLTDVEQEINGLLTYDRKPKVKLEIIRAINEGRWEGR